MKRILISKEEIQQRLEKLAQEIETKYHGFKIIALLKGSFMFVADLVRNFKGNYEIDFIKVSSYQGTNSSGELKFYGDLPDVKDQKILLIDDICDTGLTLKSINSLLLSKGATEVLTCTLLDKPFRRMVDFKSTFIGFSIEDIFVVGYGLDLDNLYRCLPEIYEFD